jgi:hypothetical protein
MYLAMMVPLPTPLGPHTTRGSRTISGSDALVENEAASELSIAFKFRLLRLRKDEAGRPQTLMIRKKIRCRDGMFPDDPGKSLQDRVKAGEVRRVLQQSNPDIHVPIIFITRVC